MTVLVMLNGPLGGPVFGANSARNYCEQYFFDSLLDMRLCDGFAASLPEL